MSSMLAFYFNSQWGKNELATIASSLLDICELRSAVCESSEQKFIYRELHIVYVDLHYIV